jgi:hypothetical protein
MFETGVVRPWIDEVRETKLMDTVKALEIRNLQEVPERPIEPYASVDGVMDDLVVCQRFVRHLGSI